MRRWVLSGLKKKTVVGGINAERASTAIQARASTEELQQQLYAIYESMDQLNAEDIVQRQRMQEWVNHVRTTLASLTNLRAEDIASRNRPWDL